MKCFTYEQARMIIEDLSSIPIKDSIISKREAQITNLYDQVFSYKSMDELKQERIVSLEEEVAKLETELVRTRKKGKVKTAIFTSLGSGIGFIISALIK